MEEGCYKRQPLGLEAKSHNRDTHYRNLRSPIKQTNKQENHEQAFFEVSDEFSQIQDDGIISPDTVPVIENLQNFLQSAFQFDVVSDEFM